MSTIVTRAGKGSPLTHTEVDSNFTNLNTDKVEASGGTLTNPTINGTVTTTGLNFDSNTLVIDATNNRVGVLQSSPAYTLDVGSTSADTRMRIIGNTQYGLALQNGSSNAFWIGSPSADAMTFSSGGGTERMRIDSSGNVGIGTSSPTTKLTVQTPASQTNAIDFIGANSTGANAGHLGYFADNLYLGANWYYSGGQARSNSSLGSSSIVMSTSATASNNYIYFAVADATASAPVERMRIDSSGNLGLGVTPSAWGSPFKAMQIGQGGFLSGRTDNYSQVHLGANAYFNGADWIYTSSTLASRYYQASGQHIWNTAASGTAGNAITFTQAMTLDASGRLMVGTTTPNGNFTVYAASGDNYSTVQSTTNSAYAQYTNTSGSCFIGVDNSTGGAFGGGVAYGRYIYSNGAYPLITVVNGSERMRIDSSGNLCINTTATVDSSQLAILQPSTKNAISIKKTDSGNFAGIQFYYNSTRVGLVQYSDTATTYGTSSDYRLKDNQTPLTGSGAFIDALQPKTWTWKNNGSTGVGFIAHEVQAVSPNSVVGEKDAVDAEGNPVYQGMEYGSAEFIANIIAELQDLRKRVATLESK